jgi:hypothetical protein
VCVKTDIYVIIKVICGKKKRDGHLERHIILLHVNISWHVGYYVCYFYVQDVLSGDGRMGTSSSRHGDLASNEYLEKFASKEPISSNEPFWNRFLSFSFTPPATRYRYEFCVLLL